MAPIDFEFSIFLLILLAPIIECEGFDKLFIKMDDAKQISRGSYSGIGCKNIIRIK